MSHPLHIIMVAAALVLTGPFLTGPLLTVLSPARPAQAAEPALSSPVGRWTTIDDETETPRSIVEIREVDGALQGRVLQIFYRDGEKPDPVCEACDGDRKDQPVIGMVFLWGLKPTGADWSGGGVLDPKNGKIYNAKLSLTDGGQTLRLRGYIGMPLLGRTQVWLRASP